MGGKTSKDQKVILVEDLMETVFSFEATKTDDRDTTANEEDNTLLQPVFQKILNPYQGQVERRLLLPTKHEWEKTMGTNW